MASKPNYKPSVLRQILFPACLLLLLLLAIPGLITFGLHVFGGDGEVNQWLEENFQLTYHFPLHWSLALVLLLIPPLILLLYFLRLKRKPLQVPSTFLWRKSIEDLHVNSLFQWLRENVLLFLQILTVLALIYAVMGFRFHGSTATGKHYILIVDNSASMATTDVKPSRLEWAKQEALKVIDGSGDDSVGMVIAFNSKAVTLQGYTTDRAKLRDAVKSIEQTSCTTRIDDALSLADSLANQIRSTEDQASQPEGPVDPGKERQYVPPKGIPTEVYLFSDGAFPELSESSLSKLNSLLAGNTSTLGNMQLHFQLAGVPGPENVNNVGILAFNVVRHDQGNPKRQDPNALRMQAFVQVRNFRPNDCEVKLQLDVESDGELIHSGQQTLLLPRRTVVRQKTDKERVSKDEPGDAQAIFELPQLDLRQNTILKVHLKDIDDDFAMDDAAWLVVGMVRKAKVLIVTSGNVVLDAFFRQEAMQKVATVNNMTPEDLKKDTYLNAAHSGQFDLVIFDRCTPEREEDMPAANTILIDRPPPPWERGTKVLKNPYLVVSKKDHPLLRNLTTLWDVAVSEAFYFHLTDNLSAAGKLAYLDDKQKATKPLPGLTRLLEATGDQPVLFTLARGSFTDLVMTFPLIDDKGGLATNWPLQLSFPLFMRNVLYVLGNVAEADRERTVQPGEPMLLRPEADIKSVTIEPPKGPKVKLDRGNRPEFIFAGTDQLGPYKVVRDDGGVRHFAVNLLDGNESNIEPRTDIKIGGDEVSAGQERRQPREMWKWIALAALMLLLVEWYIYNRRIYV
jgi:von Willebrand factor type A domain/Aerotolerance regulator N-terminal